jgi:pSer/pThr/pTyr-binding forkhead associated (FHA) protein
MARLILSLDNQVLAEYNMTKERYTIGRLPDNDVRIDNPAVSGHHSLIINILNDSFLEDLNSTNEAAEKAVASAVSDVDAQPDAREDIADYVKLNPEEAAALEDEAPPPRPEEERVEPRHSSTMTGIDPANAPNALPLAKLQVLSGAFAGRELELTKALTTLGRPGVQVAAITRRAEGYYIVHVESGKEDDFPLVNGQPIGAQARKLSDNDVVQLAGVKMGFFAA